MELRILDHLWSSIQQPPIRSRVALIGQSESRTGYYCIDGRADRSRIHLACRRASPCPPPSIDRGQWGHSHCPTPCRTHWYDPLRLASGPVPTTFRFDGVWTMTATKTTTRRTSTLDYSVPTMVAVGHQHWPPLRRSPRYDPWRLPTDRVLTTFQFGGALSTYAHLPGIINPHPLQPLWAINTEHHQTHRESAS